MFLALSKIFLFFLQISVSCISWVVITNSPSISRAYHDRNKSGKLHGEQSYIPSSFDRLPVYVRLSALSICLNFRTHCKNTRRFYGKITRNQLPVHFRYFLRAPVNIFRTQAQDGSKKTRIACGHIALKPTKVFSSVVR